MDHHLYTKNPDFFHLLIITCLGGDKYCQCALVSIIYSCVMVSVFSINACIFSGSNFE